MNFAPNRLVKYEHCRSDAGPADILATDTYDCKNDYHLWVYAISLKKNRGLTVFID